MSRKMINEPEVRSSPDLVEEVSPISRQIDDNLRKVYTSTLEEDVPERFLRLLAELRARETVK